MDNGTNLVFGTEIELRAKIEAAIAEEHQLSDGALALRLLYCTSTVLVQHGMVSSHIRRLINKCIDLSYISETLISRSQIMLSMVGNVLHIYSYNISISQGRVERSQDIFYLKIQKH